MAKLLTRQQIGLLEGQTRTRILISTPLRLVLSITLDEYVANGTAIRVIPKISTFERHRGDKTHSPSLGALVDLLLLQRLGVIQDHRPWRCEMLHVETIQELKR